jgi:hypothetical protein
MSQIPEYVRLALDALGALSLACGALSHLPFGKVSRVLGEIGLDLAGVVRELKSR